MEIKAFKECPRFDKCNVNKCPLHTDYEKLQSSEYDKEQKCTMERRVRERIGLKYGLPNQGLTQREISSQKLWDNLPESEKKARIEKLKETSPISRLSKKGDMIAPKKKDNSETHIQNEENGPRNNLAGTNEETNSTKKEKTENGI